MIIDQLSKDKLFYNLMKWNHTFQIQSEQLLLLIFHILTICPEKLSKICETMCLLL